MAAIFQIIWKMAAILSHFQMHFLEWKYINLHWNFTQFVPKGPINNIPALVEIVIWTTDG